MGLVGFTMGVYRGGHGDEAKVCAHARIPVVRMCSLTPGTEKPEQATPLHTFT